jgi:hypothetical protein
MADDEKRERVKDLLRSGTLDEHQPASADFGERVMRRHMRRPVGNSERLWRKVDGSDPWDLPEPPKPDKSRGVWAAGRFVRVDRDEAKKQETTSHIPDWARKQADEPRQAKASADPAPSSAKVDPQDKIKEVIARKQAEADAQTRAAVAARAASAPAPAPAPTEPAAPSIPIGSRPPSMSKSGRVRTNHGGSFDPTAPPPVAGPSAPEPQHRYAAGRSAPPPRKAPTDLPVEMRTPPKVDPNAPAPAPAPTQHRYAAGRSAPPPRKAPTDLPVEMRTPPRIDPNGGTAASAPPQPRYAAGRAPPPPRAAPKDLPIEQRMPPRIGPDGQPLPPSSPPRPEPGAAASAPAGEGAAGGSATPAAAPRPALPTPAASSGGNSGSLDDLFGLANEGPVRIGRRAKKVAAPDEGGAPEQG